MAIEEVSPRDATSDLPTVLAAAQQLTPDERRQIVRQARQMIEGLYVHLPLKRAMHAVTRYSACGCSSAGWRATRTGASTTR